MTVKLLDFGIWPIPAVRADIAAGEVARRGGGSLEALRAGRRRDWALDVMRGAAAIVAELAGRGPDWPP